MLFNLKFNIKLVKKNIYIWLILENFGLLKLFIIPKNCIEFNFFRIFFYEYLLEIGILKKSIENNKMNYKKYI